ncbi:DUF1615 family protein [Hyalangium rubrum]|uniref:DUF1615 family protein n=1 Tax=Hyalangium rubrum TaxID=3103134 RepID=A0ABU5GX57_9BACT|nr:DUF1615 family protein [Hyalangium sp. s54d21]MDY7225770.1 DUF1615 family protein [Hyalangium sp. s54d21]
MTFPSKLKRGLFLAGALLALTTCSRGVRGPDTQTPPPPRLTPAEVARLIPSHVEDRQGWAKDVLAALEEQRVYPSVEPVCQVLAVIEQESGFQANPVVKDLPRIVRKRLDTYAEKLGVVGRKALQALLEHRAPGESRSFGARLKAVRTERDLDRLFREILKAYEEQYPAVYTAADLASELARSKGLADLNPITTAGSMQVSVRYAVEQSDEDRPEAEVREELYTRAGGVRHGTSRLLGYTAHYAQPLHRFADYNAGFYASRNAALQAQVSHLTGLPLALDGDLLLYNDEGEPRDEDSRTLKALLAFRTRHAPKVSERQVRRDARKEKQGDFEETETWRAIKQAYERSTGKTPEYSRLPEVAIRSPKMSQDRTTAWFARSVDRRFQRCLGQHRAPAK